MKRILFALTLFLCLNAQANMGSDWLKDEFSDASYGLHLISEHAQNKGTNNGNLGFYVRTKSGWTAGQYYNSCHTYTNYYGWTSPELFRIRVSPVVATGYHCLTEKVGIQEGKRINFTVVPTIRIVTFENVAGMRDISLRGMFVPGLYHLMIEGRFN